MITRDATASAKKCASPFLFDACQSGGRHSRIGSIAYAWCCGLKPDGRLYVLGDAAQQLYERDSFKLPDAVHIRCMDNFRSPRAVVREINELGLTDYPIEARSIYEGVPPKVHLYGPPHGEHLSVTTA